MVSGLKKKKEPKWDKCRQEIAHLSPKPPGAESPPRKETVFVATGGRWKEWGVK